MTVIVSEFASGEWPKKFIAALREHPSAPESLQSLESEGVQRRVLLNYLYDYSHPASVKSQRAMRKWAGDTAKLLAKTEKQMRKSADTLESGIEDIQMGFPMAWQSGRESPTVASLRSTIEYASTLRQHYKRISSQKGKARNEELLVSLCLLVEGVTGRPHWEDLAYLLEVAFSTHGVDKDWDEDALRKMVDRFKKAHPEMYATMREFLVESRRDLPKPAPVKRSPRTRRMAEPDTTSPFIFLAKGRTSAKGTPAKRTGSSEKDDRN